MEDTSQSFVTRFKGNKEKTSKGVDASSQEVLHHADGEVADEEATNHGDAGQLTGAEERVCQEP
jgi:hypothetical protein